MSTEEADATMDERGGNTTVKIDASRAGTFLLGGNLNVHRLGFGTMRLTGDGIWGMPSELFHNRHAPPAPRGEVRGGSPSDPANLREYSYEERKAVIEKWSQEIPDHDRRVLEQIATAQKALTETASSIASGESGPIPQPEEPNS